MTSALDQESPDSPSHEQPRPVAQSCGDEALSSFGHGNPHEPPNPLAHAPGYVAHSPGVHGNPTANAGEVPGQVHHVLPSLHRVQCRFKSKHIYLDFFNICFIILCLGTKSCGHKALNGSHFDAAEFSLMSSYLK